MIQNVRKHDLRNLCPWDYTIVATHDLPAITITKPIPEHTGHKDYFPEYLKGFEQYYDAPKYSWGCYELKREYRPWVNLKQRPSYTIQVVNKTYDVELTDAGKETVAKRYEYFSNQAAKYLKLMA